MFSSSLKGPTSHDQMNMNQNKFRYCTSLAYHPTITSTLTKMSWGWTFSYVLASQNVTSVVHLQQAAPINVFGPHKPPGCRAQHGYNAKLIPIPCYLSHHLGSPSSQ